MLTLRLQRNQNGEKGKESDSITTGERKATFVLSPLFLHVLQEEDNNKKERKKKCNDAFDLVQA